MKRKTGLLFNLLLCLTVAGELLRHILDIQLLHYTCKPLIMVLISIFFYLSVMDNYNRFAILIQLGFFFSWLGDILLMFEDDVPSFFIFGLIAFLLTHICYIFAFRKSVTDSKRPSYIKQKPLFAIPFILLGITIYWALFPNLKELTIPVLVYTGVIVTMVIFALNTKNAVTTVSYQLLFAGAMVFMISDTVLSFNKFLFPTSYAEVIIMSTYIAAQYLIMKGSIAHLENSSQNIAY